MRPATHGSAAALVFVAVAFGSTAAQAVCQRSDLGGRWALTTVTIFDFGAEIARCNASITAEGQLSGTCIDRTPGSSDRSQLSGSLRINDGCVVRGSATLDGVRGTVQGQLAPGKDVLIGITFSPATVVKFDAVKR